MKLRPLFVLLSLFLALATSADRAPKTCVNAWKPNLGAPDFPKGFGVNIHFTEAQPGEINHHDGGRGVYFEDLNGHLLEIITRPYGSGGWNP